MPIKSIIEQQRVLKSNKTYLRVRSSRSITSQTYPSLLCDLTGSFRRSGIHRTREGGHLQDHSFRHAHG